MFLFFSTGSAANPGATRWGLTRSLSGWGVKIVIQLI